MNFDSLYEYRTGIGNDIHRVIEGRPLMLGGMLIEWHSGLLAHSDGDVVIHAVIDSILGAACLGDIGTMFPDSDPMFRNIDSKEMLATTRQWLEEKKWQVVNLDVIVQAEEPKLGPYKAQMKRCLASLLGMDFMAVNVKAKTNEGLGEIGQGLAIAAIANVLLRKRIKRSL